MVQLLGHVLAAGNLVLWALIFLTLIYDLSLILKCRGCIADRPTGVRHFTHSLSDFDQLWISVVASTYCKIKLLCWGMKATPLRLGWCSGYTTHIKTSSRVQVIIFLKNFQKSGCSPVLCKTQVQFLAQQKEWVNLNFFTNRLKIIQLLPMSLII